MTQTNRKSFTIRRFRLCAASLAVAVLVQVGAYAQSSTSYQLIDLGTLGGGSSYAWGINDAGILVGTAQTSSGDYHAVRYNIAFDGTISLTDLYPVTDTMSDVYAINLPNQIAGFIHSDSPQADNAALFANGNMQLAPSSSVGFGLNSLGIIGGYASFEVNNQAVFHAARFSPNGSSLTTTDLGSSVDASVTSYGYAINDAGTVVGSFVSNSSSGSQHAAVFTSNGNSVQQVDLGTLGGDNSIAHAVNNLGLIAGEADSPPDTSDPNHPVRRYHATLITPTGGSYITTDLGGLGATSANTIAKGINARGDVVGVSDLPGGFIYPAGGGMQNLNDLLLSSPTPNAVRSGNAINNFGQIAAYGKMAVSPAVHGILLNPTPPITTPTSGGEDTKLIGSYSYNLVPALTDNISGSHATTLTFLDGLAGSSGNSTYGLNREVAAQFKANPSSTTPIASDALDLNGIASDLVVVQLTFDSSLASSYFGNASYARLSNYVGSGSSGSWSHDAVELNSGGTSNFAGNRAYNSATDFHLGTYGVNTSANTVWSVVNHSGTFGVGLETSILKHLKSYTQHNTTATLTIDSYTGHTYQLQHTSSLNSPFTNVGGQSANGSTGTTLTFSSTDNAPQFYRVAILP